MLLLYRPSSRIRRLRITDRPPADRPPQHLPDRQFPLDRPTHQARDAAAAGCHAHAALQVLIECDGKRSNIAAIGRLGIPAENNKRVLKELAPDFVVQEFDDRNEEQDEQDEVENAGFQARESVRHAVFSLIFLAEKT
jgi:hypothetical protein